MSAARAASRRQAGDRAQGRAARRRARGRSPRTPVRSPAADARLRAPPSGAPACCACDRSHELFDAVEILASRGAGQGRPPRHPDQRRRLRRARDRRADRRGRPPRRARARRRSQRLDAVLPPTWSHGNPVDIVGDAPGRRYADALERPARGPRRRRDPGAELPDRDRLQPRCRAGGRRRDAGGGRGPPSGRQLGRRQRASVEAAPPPAREQSRAGLRHPGAGGAGLHAPGPLPAQARRR